MRVTSLGFRTDVALRVLEGAEVTDRGDYLVVRSPGNPDFWWGNFLLLAAWPGPGTGDRWLARFAAEFPLARHVALGVDAPRCRRHTRTTAGARRSSWPPGWSRERGTVLTCAAVRPPPHPNAGGRDPAAGVRRRLAAIGRAGRALLRPRASRATTWNAGRRPGGGSPRRAGGVVRRLRRRPAARPARAVRRGRRIRQLPARRDRPGRPAARAWPGRSSGTRAATDARSSGRAPSSSWPTRRMWPSGSTAPAGSPTPRRQFSFERRPG